MSYLFLRDHRQQAAWFTLVFAIIFGLAISRAATAMTVAGVELSEHLDLKGTSGSLQLNGAGVRYKWFFKIYVAALYLPDVDRRAERVLSADTARAVTMHFLYEEVAAAKLRDAWNSGVKSNTSDKEYEALQSRLKSFNEFFPAVVRGDTIRLEFLPREGTAVYLNGDKLGVIAGEDFASAILKVWLGDVPIDQDLKDDMLGR